MKDWSARRSPATPAQAELIAIERDLSLAELTGDRLRLARVSTAMGLDAIRRAKSKGVQVTCDVTLRHLHLNTSALIGYDSNYKVWPPCEAKPMSTHCGGSGTAPLTRSRVTTVLFTARQGT